MKEETLAIYRNLHSALLEERQEINSRIAEIEAIIGGSPGPGRKGGRPGRRGRPRASVAGGTPTLARRGRRGDNVMSIKEAIFQVIKDKFLTPQEILEAVQGIGYKSSAKNPLPIIYQTLGKNKNFLEKKDRAWKLKNSAVGGEAQEEGKPQVKAAATATTDGRKGRKKKAQSEEPTAIQEK